MHRPVGAHKECSHYIVNGNWSRRPETKAIRPNAHWQILSSLISSMKIGFNFILQIWLQTLPKKVIERFYYRNMDRNSAYKCDSRFKLNSVKLIFWIHAIVFWTRFQNVRAVTRDVHTNVQHIHLYVLLLLSRNEQCRNLLDESFATTTKCFSLSKIIHRNVAQIHSVLFQ